MFIYHLSTLGFVVSGLINKLQCVVVSTIFCNLWEPSSCEILGNHLESSSKCWKIITLWLLKGTIWHIQVSLLDCLAFYSAYERMLVFWVRYHVDYFYYFGERPNTASATIRLVWLWLHVGKTLLYQFPVYGVCFYC